MKPKAVLIAAALVFLPIFPTGAWAERVALVVGNSAYDSVPRLENPRNDATDISDVLGEIGFDVELLMDLDHTAMRKSLEAFQGRSINADIALIYYAGHGIEVGKQNYLIPVDARLESDRAVRFEAISLDDMVFAADGAKRLSVVIVDSCRDNPFRNRMVRQDPTRSLGRGLAEIEPSPNSVVAYAARGGSVAMDGNGRNSPYAEALLEALAEPGLEIGLMFRKIRDRVLEKTNHRQEPWIYGTLSQDLVYLNRSETLTDQTNPLSSAAAQEDPVLALWLRVKDSGEVSNFEDFLDRYPDSDFAEIARIRIDRLNGDEDIPIELSREETRRLQARLSILGHRPGAADGLMGPKTRGAVAAFQKDRGLSANGTLSAALLSEIENAVPETRVDRFLEEIERARRERRRSIAKAQTQQQPAPEVVPTVIPVAPPADPKPNRRWSTAPGNERDGGQNGFNGDKW